MIDYDQSSLFLNSNDVEIKSLLSGTDFKSKGSTSLEGDALLESRAIDDDSYDKLDKLEAIENKKQNRELRKYFADRAYKIACGCLLFWGLIVVVILGVRFKTGQTLLSDTAFGILTTGVTINVFAALLTVIKGLFSKIEN